ncbi:MAG: hypothetical protein IPQ13_01540 [Holophagaceae bacterium]|nr:hypothetical protein [Holophagaceae bacterium]
MKREFLLLAASLAFLACTRPEVEAFRLKPTPVTVKMSIPSEIPQGEDVRKEYSAALQAKLATRIMVVPEGVQGPADTAVLDVSITDVKRYRSGANPVAVGVATGVAVGILGAAAGNRSSAFDGFWWGLFAAHHAVHARRAELDRLGYRPLDVSAVVRLRQAGGETGRNEPLAEFDVGGDEVIDAMDPLSRREAEDVGRIREEEARAFARVVVGKLQDRFGWSAHGSPMFYRAPGPKNAEEKTEPEATPKEPMPTGSAPAPN